MTGYNQGYIEALEWVLNEVLPQIEDRQDYLHVRKLINTEIGEFAYEGPGLK